MAYWLYKSEPFKWSWQMQKDAGEAGTEWNGVRNYLARNHMRAMKIGDKGFFYHSNEGLEIVGFHRGLRPLAPGFDGRRGPALGLRRHPCRARHAEAGVAEGRQGQSETLEYGTRHLHAPFGAAGDRGGMDRGLPHGRARQATALISEHRPDCFEFVFASVSPKADAHFSKRCTP